MRGLNTNSVDLIYLDPPFNSDEDYGDPLSGDGHFKDKWTLKDVDHFEHGEIAEANEAAYKAIDAAGACQDKKTKAYLIFMAVRIMEMKRVLKSDTGHIFLHCDDAAGHHLRNLMDAVFGMNAYRGTIIWQRTPRGNSAKKKFRRNADFILHYMMKKSKFKTQYLAPDPKYVEENFTCEDERGLYQPISMGAPANAKVDYFYDWNGFEAPETGWRYKRESMQELEDQGLIHYPTDKDGNLDYSKRLRKKHYVEDYKGAKAMTVWTDIPPLQKKDAEFLDYPTQKPRKLLERIIKSATKQEDLVFDPFCGCATTLVAADGIGRRWIGCDISPLAVDKLYHRLTKDESKGKKNKDAVKPLLTEVIVFDVRDKDETGRRLKQKDPLPGRTDDSVGFVKRDIKHRLYGEQEGYCFGCWHHHPFRIMELDHKNPKKQGGQDVESNFQLLCAPCNSDKGPMTMSQWQASKKKKHPDVFEAEDVRRVEVMARLKL